MDGEEEKITAEIAIMNKEAVALAADSAVTMSGESGEKIFTSANKLFALSKYHPVGIMVYGNASFMGFPIETIIKIYRKNLNTKKFDTIEEYVNNFVAFLDNGNPMFPDSVQKEFVRSCTYGYYNFILRGIREKMHSIFDEKSESTEEEVKSITSQKIEEHYKLWNQVENIPSMAKTFNNAILKRYKKIIDTAIKEIFQKLPLSETNLMHLRKIASFLFSKFPDDVFTEVTGLVIAGFGEKESFPVLCSLLIEGIVNNRLKYKMIRSRRNDFDTNASITPFAQKEMVATFIEGIDPYLQNIMSGYLEKIINNYPTIIAQSLAKSKGEKTTLTKKLKKANKELFDNYKKEIEKYIRKNNINPIMSVVSMLPKDELAAMAEAFISLTSLKRKVTMERETVGGPIDVAVISKGDGFVWIKRKLYFKPELNPRFLASYYQEGKNE